MIVDIVLAIIGLALIVFGADFLVDGASSVARKSGVSEFVIGLTIVGFGTSCPELVVSITGAIQGSAEVSLGNVIGSNIFNTLLILGFTAITAPVTVSLANRRRDIPMMVLVTFLFLFLCKSGNMLTRLEGIVFLVLFAAYLFYCFKFDRKADEENDEQKQFGTPLSLLLIAGGLAALIGGGRLLVDHAVSLAHAVGISEKVIALTLLAGGTSLPELATCIIAAVKHRNQLALGNIIGSNIFNILLILGVSSAVTPLSSGAINTLDNAALAASAVLLWLFTYTGKANRVDRWEGALMIALFVAYYWMLF